MTLIPSCSSYPVDVGFSVFRCVDLYDPIYTRKIKSTSSDIRGEQDGVRLRCELGVHFQPRLLFELPVQMDERYTGMHFAEGLVHESHLLATGHEDQDFRL